THLPVIVDPSHAGGIADLVAPLSFAAVAAGADGLIIEVHPDPESALSDGDQSLNPQAFATLMERIGAFAAAAGRTFEIPAVAAARAKELTRESVRQIFWHTVGRSRRVQEEKE